MSTDRISGPYRVERYLVNQRGYEVPSNEPGDLREQLRIVAGNGALAPIIAEMVYGGRATANLLAASPDAYVLLKSILKTIENRCEPWCASSEHIEEIRKYIAKVEHGTQPRQQGDHE